MQFEVEVIEIQKEEINEEQGQKFIKNRQKIKKQKLRQNQKEIQFCDKYTNGVINRWTGKHTSCDQFWFCGGLKVKHLKYVCSTCYQLYKKKWGQFEVCNQKTQNFINFQKSFLQSGSLKRKCGSHKDNNEIFLCNNHYEKFSKNIEFMN